ncbi:MAG TPA: hypothetical protein PKA00_12220 [Saprospiraceae bacterium]|nr:hypothetical protein [Saprospiraceae bacterium]HMQ83672.1 hypothetical protein [Saprospiraceae bacterium]
MKRALLLTALVLVLCQLEAKTLYVKQGSNGDGSSWIKAFGNLQAALEVAIAGDTILVAAGHYLPTENGDRNKSFIVKDGVVLLGGFYGNENSIESRNPELNPTVLSGEIGDLSSIADNSYTVIYTKNVSKATVVDGFVITKGAAKGSTSTEPIKMGGAGWFNEAENGTSSPSIKNCVFIDNVALEGAGLYNRANQGGICKPLVKDCKFIRNISNVDGGAILNVGMDGSADPIVVNCQFEANEATYGAGIMNKIDGIGQAAPMVKNCSFIKNIAYSRGSGVYNYRTPSAKGTSEATMTGCRFEGNDSTIGGEINSRVNNGNDNSTINNSGY